VWWVGPKVTSTLYGWVGPKVSSIQPGREKIVLEITMGNCKMNYGADKKNKKEKRQIKKK